MTPNPLFKTLAKLGLLAGLLGAAAGLAACGGFNPVHSDNVDALGPETGNTDQYHRPGQPCTVCHGPDGPAKLQFTIAGTVFTSPTSSGGKFTGACGAQVSLVDSLGNTPIDLGSGKDQQLVPVNCVGNFFTTTDGSNGTLEFNPYFPVKVAVVSAGQTGSGIPMLAPINRETSCGKCHQDPSSLSSPGVAYAPASGGPVGSCGSCAVTTASTPLVPGVLQ